MAVGDGLGQEVDRVAMIPIVLMWTKPDGEPAVEALQVFGRSGRNGGVYFGQGGIEGGVDQGALQRDQELTGEGQGHEFRRREAEARNITEAVKQTPADLAIDAFSEQREVGGFECGEIPPDRPGMAHQIVGDRVDELRQGQPAPCGAQPLQ